MTIPSHLPSAAPLEEFVRSADGPRLFLRSWRLDRAPVAIVIINHGFLSHGGQYGWAAMRLAEAGFTVYAFDMRGRGRSEGRRFAIDDISEYVDDLQAITDCAKQREPGLPVFLLGHSVGGVVACLYALDHQAGLAGLVCESFAFEVPAPAFALTLFKVLSPLLPNLPVIHLKNADFTRDPAARRQLDADPLTEGEAQPLRTATALVRADERLRREFPRITLPLLILHGTGDRVTLPSGSRVFQQEARSEDKTLKLYDGRFHDLLNDLGRDDVMSDITGWLTARLPQPAQPTL